MKFKHEKNCPLIEKKSIQEFTLISKALIPSELGHQNTKKKFDSNKEEILLE